MVLHTGRAKLRGNQKGAAMIMVLFIVTFLSVLGALALSAALLNLQTQRMNRSSEQNFYRLEAAMDEIRTQMGIVTETHLKDSYSMVLERLYQEELVTNQKANHLFGEEAVKRLLDAFGLSEWQWGSVMEDGIIMITDPVLCQTAADWLKAYSATYGEEHLRAAVESILLESSSSGVEGGGPIWDTLLFKGFCLTYVNPETGNFSSLTVDLRIRLPYLQFINEGEALLGYALVANRELRINDSSEFDGRYDVDLYGNIYASSIQVNGSGVFADCPLLISKGTLSVENGAYLVLGSSPASSSDARLNRVYAQNLKLHNGSELIAEHSDFYIRDDMTLDGDWNCVQLGGRYYGYGNEAEEGQKHDPDNSSAILINGKYSTVDLTRLETLMLAGRAYLRFQNEGVPYVYPLAESLAIRSTQELYLIPETEISLDLGDGPFLADSNPFVLPEQMDSAVVSVRSPSEDGLEERAMTEFIITRDMADALLSGGSVVVEAVSPADANALLLAADGKFYLYFYFHSEQERSGFFEQYLAERSLDFEAALSKAGLVSAAEEMGEARSGKVLLNEHGQIMSAGAIYQVTGEKEEGTEHPFTLLTLGVGSADVTMSRLSRRLEHTFENLTQYLTESAQHNLISTESGAERLLPAGSYVNLRKIEQELADAPCYVYSESEEEDGLLLSGDDLTVTLRTVEERGLWTEQTDFDTQPGRGVKAEITDSHGTVYELSGGLIVSSGDITVQSREGTGDEQITFEGLLIAGGDIHISGSVSFRANPYRYQGLLGDGEAAPYFYRYEEESAGLSHVPGFVTMENWVKSGRRIGGSRE